MTQIVTIPGQGDAEFPDNMSQADIVSVIRKQFPVLDEKAKKFIPDSGNGQPTEKPSELSPLDRVLALPEAAVAAGQSTLAGLAGRATALVNPEAGLKVNEALQPKVSPGAQAVLGFAGDVADKLKIPPWPVTGGLPGVVGAVRQAGATAERGATVTRQAGRDLNARLAAAAEKIKGTPEMVGVGSAETEQAAIRRARAADLPVPIKLTKGQAERTFEQQQFERETAKHPETGKPLRERFADQNQKILQNFDAWVDQTGAQSGSIRATGQAVTEAVAEKANKAKASIRAAYEKARAAGDMAEQVDAAPLVQYLAGKEPESINAGVISAATKKLQQVTKGGKVSINDLEEVRKMVGELGGKDATNAHFAGEIKAQIDSLTEGRGGDLYKQARSMHREYAKEFKNVGVVDKLLRTKKGTTDRAVAYEDVFQHSILGGSLDDVRAIRKTLQTGGAKGEQAWRELQGETVKHIKERITKNVARDQNGNPVVSPAELDKIVNALDKDGKLDLIFGKKGAQQIRDVNDLAKDVYTAPPGSVNTSNTASILAGLLDTVVSAHMAIPAPVATSITYGVKKMKERKVRARVSEALADDGQIPMRTAFEGKDAAPQIPMKKAVGE